MLIKVEPCCWMTYTTHRDTRDTLQTLDRLDLDTDRPTEEDIMKRFGLDEKFRSGDLSCWQRVKPKIWALFDEPYSSTAAKVSFGFIIYFIYENEEPTFVSYTKKLKNKNTYNEWATPDRLHMNCIIKSMSSLFKHSRLT